MLLPQAGLLLLAAVVARVRARWLPCVTTPRLACCGRRWRRTHGRWCPCSRWGPGGCVRVTRCSSCSASVPSCTWRRGQECVCAQGKHRVCMSCVMEGSEWYLDAMQHRTRRSLVPMRHGGSSPCGFRPCTFGPPQVAGGGLCVRGVTQAFVAAGDGCDQATAAYHTALQDVRSV